MNKPCTSCKHHKDGHICGLTGLSTSRSRAFKTDDDDCFDRHSILEKLDYNNGRIVKFKLKDDKSTIRLKEQCDGHFAVSLNKQEFGQMIQELTELHEQMINKDGE